MEQILFLLTEVDKDNNEIVHEIGGINQTLFVKFQDALRSLYDRVSKNSKMDIFKCDDDFAFITVEKENEKTQYYRLCGRKPIHYE